MARPEKDSFYGWWTTKDDCKAILRLIHAGRLNLHDVIHEVHVPEECGKVYERLVSEKNFPVGVEWNWQK